MKIRFSYKSNGERKGNYTSWYENGYKKLAKKYGLTRDQVRTIVKSKNISLTKNKKKYMQVPKFKNIEEELEITEQEGYSGEPMP